MNLHQPLAAAVMAASVLALSASLSPASAASFTVTDVLGDAESASFTIPRLEVVDGNMTEADIRSVFKLDDLAATAKSLSSWDAASVRIPEIRYKQVAKAPDKPDTTIEVVYRNLAIEGLEDGIAKSSRIDGANLTIVGAGALNGSIGAFTTGMLDLASLVAFYAGGGGEMKTIYKDIAFEGARFSDPKGHACDIGKFAVAEFKARPMRTSFIELMAMAESMDETHPPSAAEMQTLLGVQTDVFQGMEISPSSFDGISCHFVDDKGRPVDFSVGKMESDGFGQGRYRPVTMNDLDITVTGEGFVKVGKLLFKGMDFNGVLAAMQSAGDKLSEAWFEQNFRKVIPTLDGFAIENVTMDIPDESNPGQRVKGSIGAIDVTLKAYQLGIPTDISISTDKLAVDLPAETTDEEIAQLKALGYDRVELSSAAKLRWDEASRTIVIDEVSTSGTDMGSFTLSAVLGNAGKELFAENPQTMQIAAMGLSLKQLSVSAEDGGLSERLFAKIASEQGQDPATVRTQVSGFAAGMVPMLLGGTEQAQKAANAVMTFLNGGSSLAITVLAKDAAGLGFMDFMAAQQNPAALVEKIDVSAEAR